MIITAKKYTFLPDEKSTGIKIKLLRKNYKNVHGKKLTVQNLSEKIQEEYGEIISEKAINKWEQGKSFPSIENLVYLSEIFKTPVQEILLPDNLTNIKLYDVKDNFKFDMGLYEKQYPNLFTPTNFDNEIRSRNIMDYLFQKAVFSYLSEKEKEIFMLKSPEFYVVTDYGIANYKLNKDLTILEVINNFINEKYGLIIKQRIPTDDEFNSIMYSMYKVVNSVELENNKRSYIFSYLLTRTQEDIDRVISNLNMMEKDIMITTMLALPMNKFDGLQKIYASLKKNGAMRLTDINSEMYYVDAEEDEYANIQIGLMQNALFEISNDFKLVVNLDDYLKRRRSVVSDNYNTEIRNLREGVIND